MINSVTQLNFEEPKRSCFCFLRKNNPKITITISISLQMQTSFFQLTGNRSGAYMLDAFFREHQITIQDSTSAVVLVPTEELARKTQQLFDQMGKHCKIGAWREASLQYEGEEPVTGDNIGERLFLSGYSAVCLDPEFDAKIKERQRELFVDGLKERIKEIAEEQKNRDLGSVYRS